MQEGKVDWQEMKIGILRNYGGETGTGLQIRLKLWDESQNYFGVVLTTSLLALNIGQRLNFQIRVKKHELWVTKINKKKVSEHPIYCKTVWFDKFVFVGQLVLIKMFLFSSPNLRKFLIICQFKFSFFAKSIESLLLTQILAK